MLRKRLIISCAIGNILEWYEFMIFGYFAPIIGTLFFPSSSSLISLFKAFGVFAIGVFVRPLGGILFGHIGDKYGRKPALIYSIYLMSFPTIAIGFLPDYNSIGIIAPITLLIIRVLQGLSMGGEYAGTMTYLVESTEQSRRGFFGGFAACSLTIGMALGSLVFTLTHVLLEKDQILSWGWRIPFLISVVGLLWGIYLRTRLQDPPIYLDSIHKYGSSKFPIKEIFQHDFKHLLHTILVQCFLAVSMYTLTILYTMYAKDHFVLSNAPLSSLILNTPGIIAIGVAAVVSGKLSDLYGKKKVLIWSSGLSILVAYLTCPLITQGSKLSFFIAHFSLSILTGCFLGPIPALLAESFRTKIRYTSIALSNNLSMGIFGGTAPVVITYLIDKFNTNCTPNYYLMLSAAISIISLFLLKDDKRFLEEESKGDTTNKSN